MADRRRAILIGTNRYDDSGLAQLRAPAGDVAALAHVLAEPAIGDFEMGPPLIDRPKQDIEYSLEEFFAEARPHDLLLTYLSCHGLLAEDGRLYFAATNTERTRLRATAISDWFVHDVMTQSRAQSCVLILDCCHSGAFAKGLARKGDADLAVTHRFEGKGQIALTASTKLEFAFEGPDLTTTSGRSAGSVFTNALIDGLSTGDADLDGDGRVTVDELYDFLYTQVKAATPHQTPGMSGDVRGGIVIAQSPAGPRPDSPATPRSTSNRPEHKRTFKQVWYRPAGTSGEDLIKMKAMTDRGVLVVRPGHISFTGKWTSLDITDVASVSLGRSGKDAVNAFVTVEYGDGQTAQFADGRNLGWSGLLGGTRKLKEAIEETIQTEGH